MKLLARIACAGLSLALVLPALPTLGRPVGAEDLYAFTLLDGTQISPNGKLIAVTASTLDGPKNAAESTILLLDSSTGKRWNATRGKHDGGANWMPDSSGFAFARPDTKLHKPEIFTYTVATGRIAQLTHLKDGASGALYSHDGKRIAFTVTSVDSPHTAWVDFAKAGFKPKPEQKKSDIHIITQLGFRVNGVGYVADEHSHIWVMSADGSGVKQLTSGRWTENLAAWSPDDRTLALDSVRFDSIYLGPDDIYTIPSNGGALTKLASFQTVNAGETYANAGNRLWFFSGGVLDPDEYLALTSADPDGSNRRDLVAKNTYLWGDSLLADMKEGGGTCGPLFAPGDAWFAINIDGPGYSNLRKVDAATGAVSDLTPPRGEAWSCSMSGNGRKVAYLYSDFMHPADVFVVDTAGGAPRKLTDVNGKLLSELSLSQPQPFAVTDPVGLTVHAWFMPALGTKPGEKRPTLLDIHGGPSTQFGDTFFDEFQYWAGQGYNVVFSDPRGSTGFGYAFQEALAKNWGDAMFDDTQAVMDAAVARPDVDASRLAVLGGSYGGYATLWVVSHTDRYKTAIAERAVSNLESEQFVADFASANGLGGQYSWGYPWEAGNQVAAQSPITYVTDVHTPLLLLHSDEDTRTPIDQTLQEFTALKILGRTVEYVEVPGENHDLSRTGAPIHRVERLRILSDWLRSYLSP
ncbi:MAG TPA: S9 family peptidase [Verrucomicrobiae bacterium]|jgi:dipeptidyl aminopeptidase/acylaminoacyl peptidase|nr:S9 family peptidase [Verrucomicrobiae bacterium]